MRWFGLALLVAACNDETSPRWQLRHDRIIAVRATPPGILAGETTELDAFVTDGAGGTAVVLPVSIVVDPAFATVDGNRITARDSLAGPISLRAELTVPVGERTYAATKSILVGARATNPAIGRVTLEGEVVGPAIAVPIDTSLELAVEAPATSGTNWLTSCGSLAADDEAISSLTVASEDPQSGELALVIRQDEGVAWVTWSLTTAR